MDIGKLAIAVEGLLVSRMHSEISLAILADTEEVFVYSSSASCPFSCLHRDFPLGDELEPPAAR